MTVGEVLAESAPVPEEKIQPCPKEVTPVPPLLMAKVVVACTTPLVAKSVPLKEPRPKVVAVALVVKKFVDCREEAKSVVVVALVAVSTLAKRLVEVAFVVVLLTTLRLLMEEDAAFTLIPPVNERSVEVALPGNGQVKPEPDGQVLMQVSPVRQKRVEVKLVLVPLVLWKTEEKSVVVVACEVVAFLAVKSWKVEEPVTKRLVTMVRPVLEIEKSVVVAVSLVEEEMENASGLIGEEEARKIERLAAGEVVPMPRFPFKKRPPWKMLLWARS